MHVGCQRQDGVLDPPRIHSITLMLSMKVIIIAAMAYHACEVNGAV
jgi:hypothetical protein